VGRKHDLISQRFGRLTVVAESPNRSPKDPQVRWICRCDCGNASEVTGGNLRNENTTSCGCIRNELLQRRNLAAFRNLTGRTFARLTVRGFAGRNNHGQAQWRCLCACGRETVVPQTNLIAGNTRSCGCYGRELTVLRMKAFSAAMKHISTSGMLHG
jgi:hypothetical protein